MRITVPRIRIAPRPAILVTLLIRPAPNTDNAELYETAKTYSELFGVVGILLHDHLTKVKMSLRKGCSPNQRSPKMCVGGLTESRGTNEGSC
jgi:hypothetical protein